MRKKEIFEIIFPKQETREALLISLQGKSRMFQICPHYKKYRQTKYYGNNTFTHKKAKTTFYYTFLDHLFHQITEDWQKILG